MSANPIDVPLVADVSRHQMTIRRDAEGYVVDPVRPTKLAGRSIEQPAVLADGDRLGLGPLEMVFRRPHALSATARLEFVSGHTTRPRTDGVLLMADSCILSAQPNSHVVCRDWPSVVLFRQGDGLICQAPGPLEIDGQACPGRGRIGPGSRVRGPGFSFALEEMP